KLPYYELRWQRAQAWPRLALHDRPRLDRAVQRSRGVILAPAHFGAYRWLAIELVAQGYPVTLLVDPENQEAVEQDVSMRMQEVFPELGWDRFDTVSSGETSALWSLARALRKGRIVVMFADGNSGTEGRAAPKGALHIPFLGHTIRVRPGIAALAATTGASILPVYAHASKRHHVARIDPEILRPTKEPKKVFINRAMTMLYQGLEREIERRPGDWEEWWLLPHWIVGRPNLPERCPPTRRLTLTGPSLVRRRLKLVDPGIWAIQLDQQAEVLDLAQGSSLGNAPLLTDLIDACEQNLPVRQWLDRQAEPRDAKALLQQLYRAGIVALPRDAT
ncbi:MAG: lysophospholipid acyltransferase family protein, partial [Nannocystaceae bacterium]